MQFIFIISTLIEFLILSLFKNIELNINLELYLTTVNIVFIILTLTINKSNKYKVPILFSYIVRCFLLYLDVYGKDIIVLPVSGGDTEGFYKTGLKYANSYKIIGGNLYGELYSKFIGFIFRFIGDNRLFIQYINVVLSILTIFLLIKILKILEIREKIKIFITWIASIFPMNIIISASLLRESLIIFLVTFGIYYYIKYFYNKKNFELINSIILIALSSMFHSGTIMLLAGLVFYEVYSKNKDSNFIKKIVFLIGIFAFLFLFKDKIFDKFLKQGSLLLDENYETSEAGSKYLSRIRINSLIDILIFGWIKAIYFIASPTPLYWRGLTDVITFFMDSILYIYISYKIIFARISDSEKIKSLYKILLLSLFSTIFIFGLGTSAAGTAMRHRNKLLPIFLIVLAIIENYKLEKNKENKRRKSVENISISKMLGYLKKNISLIVLSTILLGAVCFGISKFLITPRYTSNTTMIVGNSTQVSEDKGDSLDYSQIQANRALVPTYSEIVKSKGIANKVIENLDLNIDYEEFAKKVSIEPVNDTQIISVKVVDTHPERTMDIANETSMIFKDSITEIMNVDNVQILDKAVLPDEPSSPNVLRNTFIGLVLGFIIGLGIGIFKELSDTSIKSVEDAKEYFDIPVLGQVPDKKKVD